MSKKLTKNRLQLERRVLPQSLINTLHDIVANPKTAKQAAKTYGGTARDVRDTTLFEFNDKSHPKEVERVRKSFESYFENEKLNQCDLLYYGKGQHFSLHRDNASKAPTANVGGAGRSWSCSTLIHQSEDIVDFEQRLNFYNENNQDRNLIAFNIYRDGEFLATVDAGIYYYDDYEVVNLTEYCYTVTVSYTHLRAHET